MLKAIKFLKMFLFSGVLFLLIFLTYAFYTVPDEIITVPNKKPDIKEIYSLNLTTQEVSEEEITKISKEGIYKVNVKLFNTIPIKTLSVRVSKREYVIPSGEIFGLRFFTNGVVIVSTGEVETENGNVNPAKLSGLQAGDAIVKINNENVTSCKQVTDIFSSYNGTPYRINFIRNNKEYSTEFKLYFSVPDQKFLAGIWIRDSAAGIGTMTFIDSKTNLFGGLGHGVYDTQSNKILPLYNGDIVRAQINSCFKGKNGQAGELCGMFTSEGCGCLSLNCETGVYGYLETQIQETAEVPVALKDEIKEGPAQIISTVDSGKPKMYSIEIEKINKTDNEYRNLIIKIVDKELISKTGGIVQGMSGSPIIQNGMLIGAVTHVFINDPLHGYGILAETMINTSKTVLDQTYEKAS